MNKQAQGEFVHPLAFEKREGLAHEAAETLAQGAEKAFGAVGLASALPQSWCVRRGKTSS